MKVMTYFEFMEFLSGEGFGLNPSLNMQQTESYAKLYGIKVSFDWRLYAPTGCGK